MFPIAARGLRWATDVPLELKQCFSGPDEQPHDNCYSSKSSYYSVTCLDHRIPSQLVLSRATAAATHSSRSVSGGHPHQHRYSCSRLLIPSYQVDYPARVWNLVVLYYQQRAPITATRKLGWLLDCQRFPGSCLPSLNRFLCKFLYMAFLYEAQDRRYWQREKNRITAILIEGGRGESM